MTGREPRLFVDADACPVKDEIYRVAERYGLNVFVVSNAPIRVPRTPLIALAVVDNLPDAADDWIAERAQSGDIIVTADIPLASRGLKSGALVISPIGKLFTDASIGSALAGRAIGEHLRSMGETTRGPSPFKPADRSRFLQALDTAVVKARRMLAE